MTLENLFTVKQVAETSPAFSEASIRWLIFNRKQNGFDEVLVKVGGRVYIDARKLDSFIEKHRLRDSLEEARR